PAKSRPSRSSSWAQTGKVRCSCASSIVYSLAECSSGFLRPGVAQGHAAVEDGLARGVVAAVGDEVAAAFELEGLLRRGLGRGGFDIAGDGAARLRVDVVAIGLAVVVHVRIGDGEQPVVQADLRRHGVARTDPVDGALD